MMHGQRNIKPAFSCVQHATWFSRKELPSGPPI